MLLGRPVVSAASDQQRGSVPVPVRCAFRCVGRVGAVRVGVFVATALLAAACSGRVYCGPCGPSVQVAIVGVGPDPARVLQVCVDGEGSCDEVRIAPAAEPSRNPGDAPKYPCTVSDPHTGCFVEGDTAYVDYYGQAPKELDGRRVEVIATGGQSADKSATGVFQFQPAHETCTCDHSHAVVDVSATS
jgi:hypothetical protein